ncbi:MAG TPA: hypothetical protein VN428_25110 [Bryobacteraceae bacterium]|nr:hypothetical protein [Bryobacteraceae bacterium]
MGTPASATAPLRTPEPALKPRVASLDAFRGTVMTLMLAEVLHLPSLARAFPESAIAAFIAFNTSHVEWQGGSLHDMIQPGFSFLVGAALPFSIASRRAKGQAFGKMFAHAVWRAFLLIAIGILLRSIGRPQTNFTFEDTLTQIGLGYAFLFLLGFTRVRTQVIALVTILVGYWAFFALTPAPGPGYNYSAVGVPPDWPHNYTGFLAHWNKNSNPAWAFDTWFLNLFPRERPFLYNGGGYATLSFIPTLGTMILGLLTGEWLKSTRTAAAKLRGLAVSGVALILLALLLQWTGVCPIVKRIWTPAFTLYSGGCVLLILAAFYAVMEWKGRQRWAFSLMVVGMNSIAIYVMSWTMERFFVDAVKRHLGTFAWAGPFAAVIIGAIVMLIFWYILLWMYRKKIFVRI